MERRKPLKRTEFRSKPNPRRVKEILRERDAKVSAAVRRPEKGTMEWALDAPFSAKAPARTQMCRVCSKRAHHWHHWVPQKDLRVMMRSKARSDSLTPDQVRKTLRQLLRDERNLSPYCHSCHFNHENWASERLQPPQSAYEFAEECGMEWLTRLERAYGTPSEG